MCFLLLFFVLFSVPVPVPVSMTYIKKINQNPPHHHLLSISYPNTKSYLKTHTNRCGINDFIAVLVQHVTHQIANACLIMDQDSHHKGTCMTTVIVINHLYSCYQSPSNGFLSFSFSLDFVSFSFIANVHSVI